MIYDSRRDGLKVEISHSVRADDHSAVLLVKSIHESLDSILARIHVIGIKLKSEFAAMWVMDCGVPITPDAMPSFILRNVE